MHETDQTQAGIPKRRPDGSALRQVVTLVAAPLAARGGSRSPWSLRWAVLQLAPHVLKIDGGGLVCHFKFTRFDVLERPGCGLNLCRIVPQEEACTSGESVSADSRLRETSLFLLSLPCFSSALSSQLSVVDLARPALPLMFHPREPCHGQLEQQTMGFFSVNFSVWMPIVQADFCILLCCA